jgi:fumarylacetoacetate (FAA) hydrolase
MRLATLRDGSRDGRLSVVRADGLALLPAGDVARTLQEALDGWELCAPRLRALAADLDAGRARGDRLVAGTLAAPLPRAYEWIDGSTYLNLNRLSHQARGTTPPSTLETDPLVYQGGSGVLLGPTDPIPLGAPDWGLDLEGEVCAILDDVPLGTRAAEAAGRVRLFCLANDLTFRNLVPAELEKGFGFFQSKPPTGFSPFAVTPDELGPAWRGGRVHLRLEVRLNGAVIGDLETGPEMHFSFLDLIQHVTRTRGLAPGTIIGSGTVSNRAVERGVSCLLERRVRETISMGAPRTPFLVAGDRIRIEARDDSGRSLFGAIEQQVIP